MEKQAILNLAVAVLLVMNVLSFSLMGADKRRARQGKWRIRERTLLRSPHFSVRWAGCWA